MQQQLPQLFVLGRRLPDGWETMLHQQNQDMLRIALVGLLPARVRGANLGGIAHQKFMAQFAQQASKPAIAPRGLDANSHPRSAEQAIVLFCLCRVLQAPLPALASLLPQKGDLLKPRMKITAYNHHARLLSSRVSWSFSRNQFTQVEGADAVMQSFMQLLSVAWMGCHDSWL
ncbi:MAG: hypothetical protein ABSE51_00720 [Terracidiphilus sp.]|jgi:hypothetical protein